MHESPDETSRLVVNRVAGRYRGPGRRTAPGSVFVHRCISLPLKTRPPKPRKQTVRQPWVDKYGTGSGPGSPDGQPGWGGGSDRLQPAIQNPFNAPNLVTNIAARSQLSAGRYCSRFRICASLHLASAENTTANAAQAKPASLVDKYGTGSGPGSPDGQPGWGGGSDRLQPAIQNPFNAPNLVTNIAARSQPSARSLLATRSLPQRSNKTLFNWYLGQRAERLQ